MNRFDYFGYAEHPDRLLAESYEALDSFIGDQVVVPRAVACAMNSLVRNLESEHLSVGARQFMDWFISTVCSKEVLELSFRETCALAANNATAHDMMNTVVSFPDINKSLIINIFSDINNIQRLVGEFDVFEYHYAYRWLEYGVLRRANILLDGAPNRTFTLNELVPLVLSDRGRSLPSVRGVSRAVVGGAFDTGRLSNEGLVQLRDAFPSDKYLS